MAEVDTQVLSRLLKLLERNVRAGEDVDPFPSSNPTSIHVSKSVSPQKKSPKKLSKSKKNERRSKSRTPAGEEEETGDGDAIESGELVEAQELTEGDLDKLTGVLDVARDSILAADCCIALLGSDRLTKQVRRLIHDSILF